VNPGMHQVVHVIATPLVRDINVVVVAPTDWPSLVVAEPIAAVLEAVIPADHLGTPHVEVVVMTEIGTVMVVRDAAIMVAIVPVPTVAVVAAVVGDGLGLLPCGPLRLLGALWLCLALRLLRPLWLRLVLCWLLPLCLLLALRLLPFLGALWLRLMLRLLGMLWLRLVLCRLCFLSATALSLLTFLCECGKGSSKK
jgi:hypothetical protein